MKVDAVTGAPAKGRTPAAPAARVQSSPGGQSPSSQSPSSHPPASHPPAGPPPGSPQALKLTAKERFALMEQFATLIDSGIQIAPALQSMRQQTPEPRLVAVLGTLEHAVVGGLPLSAAFAAMPRAFPPLVAQMVRAGETTGQLGEMLRRTVESMELDAAMRARLRSAMIYPVIMLSLTSAVVVFLLTWILPKFEGLLRGKQLPVPTRLLMALGDGVRAHGLWLLAGLAAALTAAILFVRSERGRRLVDHALLRLPGVAGIFRGAVMARCVRTFGLLLQSGVPVHTALEHTEEVASSLAYRALWQRARAEVVGGGTLRDAVRGSSLLGPTFVQLVAAGEATATLDRVMLKAANQYGKDLERRVRDLLTLVEPVMVVLMAAVVGFVALSIMLPIFQMSRT